MRLFGPISIALLGVVACSVYSEKLLTESADTMTDGGGPPTTGGDAGSSSSGGSGSSGTTSTGATGGTSSSGGADGGSGGSDIGQGGCVSIGNGGAEELDCCTMDDTKTDPGTCGCGVPDADGDTDGTPDCIDACPADMAKTAEGTCGCGYVDATCDELTTMLIHRYSFGGDGADGAEATDSIGTAHGTVVGGTLAGGVVTLSGLQNNQYVDLPDGLISTLTDATFEIWSTWAGGASWQRLFDFGDQNTTGSMTGHSYLFLTPLNMAGNARLVYRKPGGTEVLVDDPTGLYPSVVPTHVAVVINDTANTMSLYVNGTPRGSVAFPDSLSLLIDTNNWLGRSNYNIDPEFSGTITEFRIYNAALSDAQIALSAELGADPKFLLPP